MINRLDVVFTIDKRFIQHFSVALVSLLENNRHLEIRAFLIHDIITEPELKQLSELATLIKENYDVKLNLILFNDSVFDHYKVSIHNSKTVYYRLLFTSLLPVDVKKILFLDADIIVTGKLDELAAFNFRYIAAVHDVSLDNNKERLNSLGFPVKDYFNAGVLLINLETWRYENISPKLISLADEYMDRIAWWDQDILNMYFYDKWDALPQKYNALLLKNKLKETPLIIHYAGSNKPWLYIHDHPYKNLYWKYIKFTPFKNASYTDFTFKEFMRKQYIAVLNR
jgi:lipopolysaccharide biosynthesis glycosyltransferase